LSFWTQEALQEEARRTVEESVRQRDKLIEQLELKFQNQSKELQQQHAEELEQLEQQLNQGIN